MNKVDLQDRNGVLATPTRTVRDAPRWRRSAFGLWSLSYVSSASGGELSESALTALILECQELNRTLDVTGVLFVAEGRFMQILEGRRGVVDWLYANIVDDPRHCRVTKVTDGPIATRAFADWSMRLMDDKDIPLQRLPAVIASIDRAQNGEGLGRAASAAFAQRYAAHGGHAHL